MAVPRRRLAGLVLLLVAAVLVGMFSPSSATNGDCYKKCHKDRPRHTNGPFCNKEGKKFNDYCQAKCSCKKQCDEEPRKCSNKKPPPPRPIHCSTSDYPPPPPMPPAPNTTVFTPGAVEASLGFHTCVLSPNTGEIKCFGSNNYGQLGLGDKLNRGDEPGEMGAALPVVDLGPGLRATAVAAGLFHSCAVLQPGGIVKCWGGNSAGQLGLGDTNTRGDEPGEMGAALPPVDLGPGLRATAIAVGTDYTCAILQPGGIVKCWGYNGSGQLGQGDQESRGGEPNQMGAALPPVNLGTGLHATAITAGSDFTCAVLQPGGVVKCWGYNGQGKLGLGLGPLEPNGEGFTSIGDEPGEMGDALPAVDLGTQHTNVTAISSSWAHTCALLQPCGVIKCWGYNGYGALGYGDTTPRGTQPDQMGDNLPTVDLGPRVRVTEVSAGADHTCAVLQPGGRVKCWGYGAEGRLGLGDQENRGDEPGEMGAALPAVDLGPGLTAADVAAADGHTCALLQPGSIVKCWGRNSGFNSGFGAGQLGLGDTIDRGESPGQMGANLPPVSLA